MPRKQAAKGGASEVPIVLPSSVRARLGAEADRLLEALHRPPPVSVRYNPLKSVLPQRNTVPWCPSGSYFDERPLFTLDPSFHAGAYYVQEASSMLLEQAFKACGPLPHRPVVLDLCAAPGGKSTHLAALLPPEALLVANEPVRTRQAMLQENLWKWGRPDVIITGDLPDAFVGLGEWCDLVLVDAPCSGEGMFRKDPFARAQWSQALVDGCVARQEDILDAAWSVLRPGGSLIYSTCTWEEQENEAQVMRMVAKGAVPVPVPVEADWGVQVSGPGLRCYPHRSKGEGFFMAVVRKPGERPGPPHSDPLEAPALNEAYGPWLQEPLGSCSIGLEGIDHVLSRAWYGTALDLMRRVRVLSPGIPMARPKGRSVVPHAALALNLALDRTGFPGLSVDRDGALRFLRGEVLPADGAEGIALIVHDGSPLGWVNGAGNRWNNAWPASWRIRMR